MNRKPHERLFPRRTTGLFVTGTDTGVGKTHVAAMIARTLKNDGYEVGVYKPVASGCERDAHGNLTSEDAQLLWDAAGQPGELERVCPQRFAAPLAPNVAARLAKRKVDADQLRWGLDYWREQCDIVIVEGAGGLFSPLTDEELNIDLARDLGFPLVLVAANRLGMINGALSACTALAGYNIDHIHQQLKIAAIVVNDATHDDKSDPSRDHNADELKHFSSLMKIARVRCCTKLRHGRSEFQPAIDWLDLSRTPPS